MVICRSASDVVVVGGDGEARGRRSGEDDTEEDEREERME